MKKICFADRYGLTKAVIDGTKTMTRRVCRGKRTGRVILAKDVHGWRYYPEENIVEFVMNDGGIEIVVPAYKQGEVAAVAQSYKSIHEEMMIGDYGNSIYDAFRCAKVAGTRGWTNKLFTKPGLMPHKIQMTGVNVEPLQDISYGDCLKEGVVEDMDSRGYCYYRVEGMPGLFHSPNEAFADLINRPEVGHHGLWVENPFVLAYEFSRESGAN